MKNFFQRNYQEILVGGLILLMYAPTFLWMWDRWFARDTYYSHGILVPFVTGYLIWQQKKELSKIERRPSRWGIPLLVIATLVHLVSSSLRVYFSSGFSLLLVILGYVLYFYGEAILRRIWFPIIFLVFMIPIPLYTITQISFQMKIFAAEIGERILNQMGFMAVREGSIIKMQHTYVVVDDVCSGLRSLISLMALGSLFAYFMKSESYKKIILFLSSIPIAIVTNVFRVVLLSSIAEIWGAKYTFGFVHDFSGFLVFALAFILLMAVGRLMA